MSLFFIHARFRSCRSRGTCSGVQEITFVVSRGSATHTRLLILKIPGFWRSRSSSLEIPGPHSRSLFLVMFSHRELVSPAVVRVCRYLLYCTGGPPLEIVSCAGAFYSWRHIAFCPFDIDIEKYISICIDKYINICI